MKIAKKISILFLIVVLCFSVTACVDLKDHSVEVTSAATQYTTAVTEALQETTAPVEIDLSELVVDAAYYEHVDRYDSIVHYYHIPKINLPGDIAAKVNAEILSDTDSFSDPDILYSYPGLNYIWGYYDNIVSVVTIKHTINGSTKGFTPYNVSTRTGERLSDSEVAERFGYSEDELYALIKEKVGAYYVDSYSGAKHMMEDLYYRQYDRTIADKNIDECNLFISEAGDMCCVATIYSLAGADSHSHLVNLTGDYKIEIPDLH